MKFTDPLSFDARTRTILIAEPDAILRQGEWRALSPMYQVVQTSNAAEAVRFGARHESEIDLLLTEARLPSMDGWHLAELLKLDYPNLKIVYLSDSIDSEIRARTRPSMIFLTEKNRFRPALLLRAVTDVLAVRD